MQILILISGIIVSIYFSTEIGLTSVLGLCLLLLIEKAKHKHTDKRAGKVYIEIQFIACKTNKVFDLFIVAYSLVEIQLNQQVMNK